MNSAEFRGLLRRHRDAQRLSQDELGKRADLSYSMISRLESGERDPMPDTIGKLVTGLDLPEESADRLFLSAGYLPPALIGPHEHDATILRAWHCLRRPLDGTDKLAAVIDNAVKLLVPEEAEGTDSPQRRRGAEDRRDEDG
jgi:transcriptional regulator with XRE-family HTH domain